jgi:uncharacterized membrane protein YedE/YeeE
MSYWPFWLGGLFLASVPIAHWLLLRRMFAVSGRFSSVTDWLRGRREIEAAPVDEMLLALQRETIAEFGEEAAAALAQASPVPMASPAAAPVGLSPHLLFLISVTLGGTASVWLATGHPLTPRMPDGGFVRFFGRSPVIDLALLFLGGLLVGFGTRMAGGCTSGHGLCGVSRLQPGSLVATACFFGCAIAVSFALQALLG